MPLYLKVITSYTNWLGVLTGPGPPDEPEKSKQTEVFRLGIFLVRATPDPTRLGNVYIGSVNGFAIHRPVNPLPDRWT